MSRYLLDTHVLLWWLADPSKLSISAQDAISRGSSAVYVSAAAGWEMGIKKALGRLEIPTNLEEVLAKDRIEVLPIGLRHALAVADLPLHHQDSFDRMMIVQAQMEDMVLVTRDAAIGAYDVELLHA